MGFEHTMWWPWAGMWVFPVIMFAMMIFFMFIFAGRRGCRPPWVGTEKSSGENGEPESALEILKKRYAKGEISKDEFERMKKDILS